MTGGDIPFVFRGSVRSNSDVQVINVGEQQLVSMSSKGLGAFLLCLPFHPPQQITPLKMINF